MEDGRLRLTEGTVIAGRFRLVRALGRGGMGEVWLAHHTGLDTPCAVKFIHAHVAAAKETRARFEREAKVVAQLKSPHVVQVLDYGECEGMPYIAMEYLEGEDLGRRLYHLGRLAPMDTWLLVSQIARALGKAHAAGLVHRDLKPENVFLIRDEDTETVKILDFGIAKTTNTSISHGSTATGALLGTPSYMSPEQAQGIKSVDWRSDLWSLAVVTYRCLTGQLPFISEALGDLLVKIIVQPLPIPTHVAPDLPAGIDGWWARAAARDPAQRFQSAKEMVDALAAALELSTAGYARPSAVMSQPYGAVPALTPSGDPRYSGGQWTPQGAPPGAPITGDPVANLSFGSGNRPSFDSGGPPVHPTVPGISHTMSGGRARRARVGVIVGVIIGAGAVLAGAALMFGRGGGEETVAGAAASGVPMMPSSSPEATSATPSTTASTATPTTTAQPDVAPETSADPLAPASASGKKPTSAGSPGAGAAKPSVATTAKPSVAAPAKTNAPAVPSKPSGPGF